MGVHPRRFPALAIAVGSLLLAPAVARGQDPAPARRTVITLNPLGVPFEYFSGEFERVLNGLTTAGVTFSYLGAFDDVSYSTLEWKFRFYPNEEAPKGFSVGLSAGLTRVSGDVFDGSQNVHESETRPTVGVVVDYNWILGRTQRFLVGTGLGAKRILGSSGDIDGLNIGYPTVRFQIGFLF